MLPLKQEGNFLPFGRLTMLQYGYLIIATALGESFSYDRLRLVFICNLSEIEISLLSFMSLYIPNRIISNCSDVSDCRVKVTVRILIQKLLLKNWAALAVFADESETMLPIAVAGKNAEIVDLPAARLL